MPLLSGLIGAVDGERDPRNLLLVFSLVGDVVHSGLALQPFVEELFEVVAAYFPIDFVPVRHLNIFPMVNKIKGVCLSRGVESKVVQ